MIKLLDSYNLIYRIACRIQQ